MLVEYTPEPLTDFTQEAASIERASERVYLELADRSVLHAEQDTDFRSSFEFDRPWLCHSG